MTKIRVLGNDDPTRIAFSYTHLDVYKRQLAYITKEDVVTKLFSEIAPKYADRNGGYTRIYKLGERRGDGAQMAILELVD